MPPRNRIGALSCKCGPELASASLLPEHPGHLAIVFCVLKSDADVAALLSGPRAKEVDEQGM